MASSCTGTRTRTTLSGASALNRRPAIGLAYAAKLVRGAISRISGRDLALGAATLAMLLIVGVQTKVLVFSHGDSAHSTAAVVAHADQTPDGSEPPKAV